MKILMYSPVFYPSVGGLEAVVAMLAEGLSALGCNIKVVTTTRGSGDEPSTTYEIIRSPSATKLLSLVRWSDVFFHQNVSLKGIWPLLLTRRSWVVAHHGWYCRSDGTLGWQDRLKHFIVKFATNIAVSQAVADHMTVPCAVIPNPYRDDLFRVLPQIKRERDLVFLGRLVSDKGCDLLLQTLGLLRQQGMCVNLSVIGTGPEENNLTKLAHNLGVADQVDFVGKKGGEDLVRLLNQHSIMVVPSRWDEPFGIVALEGLSCGCFVIASSGGGLPEAIGPCGVIFPNGNAQALADCVKEVLLEPLQKNRCRSEVLTHLASHNQNWVARAYYNVLSRVVSTRGRGADA